MTAVLVLHHYVDGNVLLLKLLGLPIKMMKIQRSMGNNRWCTCHRKQRSIGYVLLTLSKMAIKKRGGKGCGFKNNRNCEVLFFLQKQ
jgi:hypothetical protein